MRGFHGAPEWVSWHPMEHRLGNTAVEEYLSAKRLVFIFHIVPNGFADILEQFKLGYGKRATSLQERDLLQFC